MALCMTPDLAAEGAVIVAAALIDAGAVIPQQLLAQMTPDWVDQSIIDLIHNAGS